MRNLVLTLVVCLLAAPFVFSQNNASLQGDFPFNETLHIVQQPAVNGMCGSSLVGPVSTAIYNDQGIWSFDGKGNVHMTDSGTFITSAMPTDASQVVPSAAECYGTYNLLDSSTVDFHYKCSLDHFVSYFQVHTTGRVTNTSILVEDWVTPDGKLEVTPYVYGNTVVGCSYVLENTTMSIK
jgi:hypothetical protein